MNKLLTKLAELTLGLAMASGVGVAIGSNKEARAERVSALTASDISSSPVSSVTNGKKYVIASSSNAQTAPSGSQFLAAKASNTWGTAVAIGSAYEFTAEGSGTSGFYLKCKDGYLAPKTGSSNSFLQYASSSSNAVQLQLKNTCELFSNANAHYNLRQNGASGFRWYGTSSADGTTGTAARLYEVSEGVAVTGVTLNKASLSLTVGDSETLTATVSPNNATDKTVTWTSSKPSVATVTNGSVSAESAGETTITVTTTDGSFKATCEVTVSNPTTPTISLNGNSFTGYTGQSFSVTATYSNLTSAFAWSTSGSGTTTETITSTGSSTEGTSTYSGTLTGAGTKTISATGGGASSQTYTVSITKTTVNITKDSTSIPVGRSETLAASHNASSVGGLNWTSDNAKVSVGSDGKVTVANDATVGATATITATSSVDSTVSDTCTVTVSEAPLDTTYDFVSNFASYNDGWASSYGTHEGIDGKTQLGGDYDATIDLYYASKQTGTITDRPVFASKTGSGSWAQVVHFTLNESKYKINEVQVTFSQWGTKTPDVALFSGDEATGTPLDSGTIGTKNTISATGLNTKEFTVGYCDKNTGSNVQAGLTSIYISLVKDNVLDNVTVSFDSDPADRTFVAGSNFAFNGTLTASYTVDSPKAVTPSSYHMDSESGLEITSSTVLSVSTHNGKTIYVVYSEGGVTKSDSFVLIVNYSPVTSIVIDTHSAEISLNETFDYTQVGVTVNTQYSDPGYEWIVSANTVSDDYTFSGSGLLSGDTEGTITLRCRSTADNSKYAELVVTVTGDPTANFSEDSVSGYVGKDTSVAFTYGNIDDTSKISVSSSSAAVSVGAISASNESGSVAITFVSAGSATLTIHYDGGSALDSITVSVSADSVVALNWTASNINVYSGAVLPVAIEDTWMVNYEMASGDADYITYSDGDYTVKLGGSTITLPHTWVAEDDGKTLCVEYMGFESSTVTVSVAQTLRPIIAAVPGESAESNLTFTAAASGEGTADDGKTWTVTSDGSESTFDSDKGIHYGTSKAAVQYIKLTSSDFTEGTITQVVVNASTASGVSATAGVKINGAQFGGEPQSLGTSATDYTFTGSASAGDIEVEITKPSSAAKAIYCKSVVVTYQTASGESVNIANVAGHEAAQKAVVKYAIAFNEALGATENCTTGLSSAWSSATSAWNTFTSEAAALGSAEEAYAKNLIKYATAQYTEGTDENYEYCLERAMATYERCVSAHGQTAFMDAVRPVGSNLNVHPLMNLGENTSTIAIIVIISMVSLTAIGGFLVLRKRKENQ